MKDAAIHLGASFTALAAELGSTVTVDGPRLLAERQQLSGWALPLPGRSVGGASRLLRTADGWLSLTLARPEDVESLPALFESDAAAFEGDPWPALAAATARRSGVGVRDRAALLGMSCALPYEQGTTSVPAGVRATSFGTLVRRRHGPPVVVDLSALWAGPLCAHLLGHIGATVVKVEAADRLDGARKGPTAFYDHLHAGHHSVVLDVHSADGRLFLHRLCETADVVITSARPRAIAGLGLDPLTLLPAQSISAWVSITGFGPEQPDRIGFGDDAAVAGGLLTWNAGQPSYLGDAIADPLTGLAAAVAVLRALTTQQTTQIEVGLAGVAAANAASTVTDPDEPDRPDEPCGTDEPDRPDGSNERDMPDRPNARHSLDADEPPSRNPSTPAALPGTHTELWWRRCASV